MILAIGGSMRVASGTITHGQNLPSAKDAAIDGVVAHGVPPPRARDQLFLRDNPRRMLTEDQDRIEVTVSIRTPWKKLV